MNFIKRQTVFASAREAKACFVVLCACWHRQDRASARLN